MDGWRNTHNDTHNSKLLSKDNLKDNSLLAVYGVIGNDRVMVFLFVCAWHIRYNWETVIVPLLVDITQQDRL